MIKRIVLVCASVLTMLRAGMVSGEAPTSGPVMIPTAGHRVLLPLVFGGNLVPNPSLEEGQELPWRWTPYIDQGSPVLSWDVTVTHTGQKSIKIAAVSGDRGRWFTGRDIPIVPGAAYEFGGYLRTALSSGQVTVVLTFWTKDLQYVLSVDSDSADGWSDWRKVSAVGMAPDGAQYARLECRAWNTVGEVWYDDLYLVASTPSVTPIPTPTTKPGFLLFQGDFESGNLASAMFRVEGGNPPTVGRVQDGYPVRKGTYSMKSYLHRYESANPYRTEAAPVAPSGDLWRFTIGEEYWVGLSVYVPSDWVSDIDGFTDIIFQVFGPSDPGEGWRKPMLALEIDGDNFRSTIRWSSEPITPTDPETYGGTRVRKTWLSDARGKWTDFVINVKWSYVNGGPGFTKIWKNGVLWFDDQGPNCFNDQLGPYIEMGLYKWPWRPDINYPSNTNWRVIYHDELKIGGPDSGYAGVAP